MRQAHEGAASLMQSAGTYSAVSAHGFIHQLSLPVNAVVMAISPRTLCITQIIAQTDSTKTIPSQALRNLPPSMRLYSDGNALLCQSCRKPPGRKDIFSSRAALHCRFYRPLYRSRRGRGFLRYRFSTAFFDPKFRQCAIPSALTADVPQRFLSAPTGQTAVQRPHG